MIMSTNTKPRYRRRVSKPASSSPVEGMSFASLSVGSYLLGSSGVKKLWADEKGDPQILQPDPDHTITSCKVMASHLQLPESEVIDGMAELAGRGLISIKLVPGGDLLDVHLLDLARS